MVGTELSYMTPQTQSASASGSNFPDYTYQAQKGYQNSYAPPPSRWIYQASKYASVQSTLYILFCDRFASTHQLAI